MIVILKIIYICICERDETKGVVKKRNHSMEAMKRNSIDE